MTNNTSDHDSSKTYTFPKGTTLQKSSIISVLCRICYDGDKDEELIQPCNCKGTVAFVHKSCLETWLGESNTTACELCHTTFETERTPRYSSRQSVWQWIRANPSGLATTVRTDVVACIVITPLAIVITYVCLFSAEYYNQKKFSNVPITRWTSISLLIMIGIMLFGYYMWVYSVIRMHASMWYNWWQRTCDVRYIAPVGATHVAVAIDITPVNRDIPIPFENSDSTPDKNQCTVIEMEESLKHMLPKHVQSRSHETAVIEMENIQNKGQSFIEATQTMEHSKNGDICNIHKITGGELQTSSLCIVETQLSGFKDDQHPSCSNTPTIQRLNKPPLSKVGKTKDMNIQTKEQFSNMRSGNIAACVSTGISANQQFSKDQLPNIVILGDIGDKEELLPSVSKYDDIESKDNKQACSSTANQSEGVEPRDSQEKVDSHDQGRSQHVIRDVSKQGSSYSENKK